jgi:hypothetical protein
MRIPELSVMFSEHFAGNGNGYVTTGPFQGFEGMKTGRLYRNLGQSIHGPISSMNAGNILRQMRTEQITFPTADLENSLEQAHNDVHDWVGGQMGKIDYLKMFHIEFPQKCNTIVFCFVFHLSRSHYESIFLYLFGMAYAQKCISNSPCHRSAILIDTMADLGYSTAKLHT